MTSDRRGRPRHGRGRRCGEALPPQASDTVEAVRRCMLPSRMHARGRNEAEEDEVTKAIAVVAHFDDAVIWAGGAIRRTVSLGWEWTIVCTCAAERSSAAEYFLESCDVARRTSRSRSTSSTTRTAVRSRGTPARRCVRLSVRLSGVLRLTGPSPTAWIGTASMVLTRITPRPRRPWPLWQAKGSSTSTRLPTSPTGRIYGISDLGPVARSEASHCPPARLRRIEMEGGVVRQGERRGDERPHPGREHLAEKTRLALP